jgi:hypothetical protein
VTSPRALALPVAAGLVAAAATFAVVTAVDGDEREGAGQPPATARAEAPSSGREVFVRMGCGGCHRFADVGSSGDIGPDLDERLAAHDHRSLEATILAPPAPGRATPSA